jgi:hypothetical protein
MVSRSISKADRSIGEGLNALNRIVESMSCCIHDATPSISIMHGSASTPTSKPGKFAGSMHDICSRAARLRSSRSYNIRQYHRCEHLLWKTSYFVPLRTTDCWHWTALLLSLDFHVIFGRAETGKISWREFNVAATACAAVSEGDRWKRRENQADVRQI